MTLPAVSGAMEAERCEAFRRRPLEGLRGLLDRLQGQTWGPDEVPASTARVRDRIGDVAPGAMAAAAFARPASTARENYGRLSGADDDHDLAEPIVTDTATAEVVAAEGLSEAAMSSSVPDPTLVGRSLPPEPQRQIARARAVSASARSTWRTHAAGRRWRPTRAPS
ncbi:MAG: hypothetical protein ACK5U8_28280, partial [Deltaproteobacteria bacterium]